MVFPSKRNHTNNNTQSTTRITFPTTISFNSTPANHINTAPESHKSITLFTCHIIWLHFNQSNHKKQLKSSPQIPIQHLLVHPNPTNVRGSGFDATGRGDTHCAFYLVSTSQQGTRSKNHNADQSFIPKSKRVSSPMAAVGCDVSIGFRASGPTIKGDWRIWAGRISLYI